MFAQHIIKHHINTEDIQHIVSHHGLVFLRDTIKTIVFLFVLYLLFLLVGNYTDWKGLSWIFALAGIIIFVKFFLDFINLALDSLILSKNGITFFSWDGLFSYKTDFFEWSKIETIAHTQNSIRDKMFIKGDLIIKLEHGVEYSFEHVSQPKKHTKKILTLKDQYTLQQPKESTEDERFAMITEALSEVVKEYLGKKGNDDREQHDRENF